MVPLWGDPSLGWAGPNFHIRAAIYDEERKVEDGTMAGQRYFDQIRSDQEVNF